MFKMLRKPVKVIQKSQGNERITINANVQPNKNKSAIPKKYKGAETYVLYTDTALDELDVVIINDIEFEVVKIDAWQNGTVVSHYEIYVAKI